MRSAVMSRPAVARDENVGARFAALVRLHEATLQGYALKLAGDRADASDLVQDTLERGLRAYSSFDEGTNARAWLCAILYNVFVDRLRKRKSEATSLLEDDVAAEEPLAPPRWTAITPEQLRDAVARLDPEFRVVCELRLVERLPYAEIAVRLRLPRNTVATRLLRGRDKLKLMLEQYLEEAT
jgi:RNA polymerase sigma-70 factor (ECF subfamily)